MKRVVMLAVLLLSGVVALAGLDPDTITLTWVRSDVSAVAATNAPYLSGVTYRLTNCVALISSIGGTNNTPQDLTGLTVTVRVGDDTTNIAYTATAQSGTNGLFDTDITFPAWTPGPTRSTVGQEGIQLTITDTNTSVSITYRARKLFSIMNPLN